MPNEKGWPDAAKPGFPTNPDREGPHLISDASGQRRWYFWMPVGQIWLSSFQCSPSFAAEHWSYIGAAIAPGIAEGEELREPNGGEEVVEFAEEELWSNHNHRQDVEVAIRTLVHEIVRSRGLSEINMDMNVSFNRLAELVTEEFHWLAGTAVLRKIIANEFGMPTPPLDFP